MLQVAAIQTWFSDKREENIARATDWVKRAAQQGAQVILLPELFEGYYFPRQEKKEFFKRAQPAKDNVLLNHFQKLAGELAVVLPISFFEVDHGHYYNSMALMDERGTCQGIYRKTFIPSGPGYEEKFYFESGDTGFKVWSTSLGKIGVGICWDQWFPEASRAMALQGADIILYPTCIGTEPEPPHLDTQPLWQKVMVGQAIANVTPIIAANRIGTEAGQTYYGSSFIANHRGELVSAANRTEEKIVLAALDVEKIRQDREDFGLLRDWQTFYGNRRKNA